VLNDMAPRITKPPPARQVLMAYSRLVSSIDPKWVVLLLTLPALF
jgi:hypothetical protein